MSTTGPVNTVSRSANGTSIAVDNVQPSHAPVWSETLAVSVARRFYREVLFLPQADQPVINSAMAFLPEPALGFPPEGIPNLCHPLIDAVHTAFSQHYPLTLSPDAVWLAIAQGFSHHIAQNAEALRKRLVRHERRLTLTQNLRGVEPENLRQAIAGFSSQIRDASDPVLHETMICDFSTTTPDVHVASQVVLMDSYRSYFQYDLKCICGIPRITVTGTLEDWTRIRARIEVLATYELEWWAARLRPIVDEFIHTIEGRPNPAFWKAIYKPREVYVATQVTGWIADLFPYLQDAPERQRNNFLTIRRKNWLMPNSERTRWWGPTHSRISDKGISYDTFPSGLSSVPVQLLFPGGATRELDFVAGFLAVAQSPLDLSLSPLIGWSLVQRAPASPIVLAE